MKPIFLISALGLAMLNTPVVAQEAATAPAPATTKKLDARDPNAIRCRKIDVIGSLVKKERICKTNAQWAASADAQNRDADDLITRSRAGMNPSM